MTFARLCGGWALGALLLAPGMAPAAWDNVFQLTCCGNTPRVSNFWNPPSGSRCCPSTSCSPCTSCAPPTCCPQTAFVQRSFYQPVTVFRPVTTCEPVTTMRTSFFYEPVTTMRTSCFVDPCTGCTQQVQTPQTCFQLRQQCNAVTSFVQRVSYQPVTMYRQSFFYDPVTINPCPPTVAAAPACPTCPTTVAAPAVTAPPTTTESTIPPMQQTAPPPLNIPQDNRSMPSTTEKSIPSNLTSPKPAAPVRADRLASRNQSSSVAGSVVSATWQPLSNSTVRFVREDQSILPVSTDAAGKFNVILTSGKWRIYTQDATGKPTYHSEITVNGESRNLMVVNR